MNVWNVREMHPCSTSKAWLLENSPRMEDGHPEVLALLRQNGP